MLPVMVPIGLFVEASVSAVDVLAELMGKRYIPRSPAAAAAGKDVGADLLVNLVAKAVGLLQKYRAQGDVDDSPVVLPLVEFITSFAESHLERCLASPSSSLAVNIHAFLSELASLSTASMVPEVGLDLFESH